jgi:hypothetical protein
MNKAGIGKQKVAPEYVDCDALKDMFGIKRALAYALLKDGHIAGVSLRNKSHPKAKRGKRLFEVASVRKYLQSME